MDECISRDQIIVTLTNNKTTIENVTLLVLTNRTEISQNTFSCD